MRKDFYTLFENDYWVVYSKLNNYAEACFRSRAWAERFIEEQQQIWNNAKFRVILKTKHKCRKGFCSNCGSPVTNEDSFCSICGYEV